MFQARAASRSRYALDPTVIAAGKLPDRAPVVTMTYRSFHAAANAAFPDRPPPFGKNVPVPGAAAALLLRVSDRSSKPAGRRCSRR